MRSTDLAQAVTLGVDDDPLVTSYPPATKATEYSSRLRFVFLPDRRSWCLLKGKVWYRVVRDAEVAELLSIMQVEIIDSRLIEEFPLLTNRATIEQLGAAECIITFRDSSGHIVGHDIVTLDNSALVDVAWIIGAYSDGWIELNAELEAEATGALSFELYLPPSEELSSKEFVALIAGQEVARISVPRGTSVLTPAIPLDSTGPTRLRLSGSYSDPGSEGDMRDLGFVVVRVLVDDIPVMPSGY
jgi:hypothetical protein